MGSDHRAEETASRDAFLALISEWDRGERRRGYAFSVDTELSGSYPATSLLVEARYGTDDEVCWRWEFPLWEATASGEPELTEDWGLTLFNMTEDLGMAKLFLRKRPTTT